LKERARVVVKGQFAAKINDMEIIREELEFKKSRNN
jgi:hypothetical protein